MKALLKVEKILGIQPTYTQHFDRYQFVQVKKSGGLNRAYPHDDYFEGRMIEE